MANGATVLTANNYLYYSGIWCPMVGQCSRLQI